MTSDTMIDVLDDVLVQATVELGRRRISVRELSQLAPDSVVLLDDKVDEPVRLVVGGQTIALGRLVIKEGETGVSLEITGFPAGIPGMSLTGRPKATTEAEPEPLQPPEVPADEVPAGEGPSGAESFLASPFGPSPDDPGAQASEGPAEVGEGGGAPTAELVDQDDDLKGDPEAEVEPGGDSPEAEEGPGSE